MRSLQCPHEIEKIAPPMGGVPPCGWDQGPSPNDASHRQGPLGPIHEQGGNYPDTGGEIAETMNLTTENTANVLFLRARHQLGKMLS